MRQHTFQKNRDRVLWQETWTSTVPQRFYCRSCWDSRSDFGSLAGTTACYNFTPSNLKYFYQRCTFK